MSGYKTVIVSNRLPVNVTRKNGELCFEPSSGGLASAMSSLDEADRLWVGWPGIDDTTLTDQERNLITTTLRQYGCVPVFLSLDEISFYYEGYSNDTLWPLFHYFQSVASYRDDYWRAYVEVNKKFANVLQEIMPSDAKVWIHDYHFMLLPGLLREVSPSVKIGFFLHIPFPSFEIFRLLPQRKEILQGLLGADIVGFHVFDYAQYFLDSCVRLLGVSVVNNSIHYEGRQIRSSVYPIGIDYKKFRRQIATPDTVDAYERLQKTYGRQKLVLSIDRLDYSKGIPERLEAFRLFLEKYPEYHGKITLLMVAVPSRTEVKAYQALRDEVERTVSRINGAYGTVHWAPISYQFQNRPFSEIVALYERADIMLVTPIRDGMNLVAKEYVASKKRRKGVLILSEMTGAIDELTEAVRVNPNDTLSLVDALHQAVDMPVKEQLRRLRVMQAHLSRITVQHWAKNFIEDLASSSEERGVSKLLAESQQQHVVRRFKNAKRRLILLDYDGTLRDFVNTPSPLAAAPTLRIRRVLKQLTDQPNTTVAIVSGRPRRALSSWFIGLPVVLAAEHGAWQRTGRRWTAVENTFKNDKKAVVEIMQRYVDRTRGAVCEVKDFAVVWHYSAVEPELAFKRTQELYHELVDRLQDKDVSVHKGRSIIEVKPRHVTKGAVVRDLQQRYRADFVLCAGDDYTDEDMFLQLDGDRGAVTIKVREGETSARYSVQSPSELLTLLQRVAGESTFPLAAMKTRRRNRRNKK